MLMKKFFIIVIMLCGLTSVRAYNISGNLDLTNMFLQDDGYLAFAEKMPEVVGGLDALYKNLVYPPGAIKTGVQGRVFVLAFIAEDGALEDVKVLRGIGGGCDEAAVDAVKRSKFKGGSHEGKPAKVKLSLTINFKL